jgi:hypothetical protein
MNNVAIIENCTNYDGSLTRAVELAKNNKLEAQRLALDASRILADSSARHEEIKRQGYFQRLRDRLTGKKLENEMANVQDFHQLQQMSFRYLEIISQNDLLMMESIATIKNQLNYLVADNLDTKRAITNLADKLKSKIDTLEHRIERLETTTAIHGWLLTIDELDYCDRYPINIRVLSIVKDFRAMKDRDWTITDMRCLKSALRKTNIQPTEKIKIQDFVDSIATDNYPDKYTDIVNAVLQIKDIDTSRVHSELSLPLLSTMYQFADQYLTHAKVIENLVKLRPDIPPEKTVSDLIINGLKENRIGIDSEVEYQHLAMELLTGVNMAVYFASKKGYVCPDATCILRKQGKIFLSPGFCPECGKQLNIDHSVVTSGNERNN